MPKTVLLGWELGAGLGHAARLLDLARGLEAAGLRPVLALRSVSMTWPLLRDAPFPCVPAPLPPFLHGPDWAAGSYADLLAAHGFADPDRLLPVIRGWESLLDVVRPDVVVCDHAPALCLTTYGSWPTVLVGNGFCVPPSDVPAFPKLTTVPETLPEVAILEGIRQVQRRRHQSAPITLPGLFSKASAFLTVLPELDPYQRFRAGPPAGPLKVPAMAATLPAQDRYFAYLSAEPWVGDVLVRVAAMLPGTAYVRDISRESRDALRKAGVDILDAPARLDEVLAEATVVIHHGSLGLSEAALAVGRPQVCLPMHLEHRLNSNLVTRLGVAAEPGRSPDAVASAIQQVSTQSVRERARAAAEVVRTRGHRGSLRALVELCMRLAER